MKQPIPDDALQQHLAVLGKTGSGKTFAVKGIVEGWLEERRRVAIVDPTGAWWGLRSSRDGKSPGFEILVLGGDHGDLPLPALGGAAVARLVAERGVSLVADTSLLTVGERTRWFYDFASTLYRANRAPLHLVLDEAHNFAPQGKVPDPDTGKMLHAANTLASGGRSRGIRLAMITQRPQKLHKDALTSADTLIAMRVLAPHDRLAVEDWIKGCGDVAQGKEVLNSLASLKRGEGWAWWPEGGYLQRLTFPPIRTFDSSATPTDGGAIAAPKSAAAIDLTEIRAALADAVREAEENDPKRLRAEVARLKKLAELRATSLDQPDPAALEAEYSRGREAGEATGFGAALNSLQPVVDRLTTLGAAITETIDGFRSDVQRLRSSARTLQNAAPVNQVSLQKTRPVNQPQRAAAAGESTATLKKGERLVLTALAQYPEGRTKNQVAILTGYAVTGGGFNNILSALRSRAWIERDEPLRITEHGLAVLGPFTPLPSGRELLDHWYRQLPLAAKKALEVLADAYPRTLSKAQVANLAGYEADGGGFNNALSRLRTLELIKGSRELKASDEFFQ